MKMNRVMILKRFVNCKRLNLKFMRSLGLFRGKKLVHNEDNFNNLFLWLSSYKNDMLNYEIIKLPIDKFN